MKSEEFVKFIGKIRVLLDKGLPDGRWLVIPNKAVADKYLECLQNGESTDWLTVIPLDEVQQDIKLY